MVEERQSARVCVCTEGRGVESEFTHLIDRLLSKRAFPVASMSQQSTHGDRGAPRDGILGTDTAKGADILLKMQQDSAVVSVICLSTAYLSFRVCCPAPVVGCAFSTHERKCFLPGLRCVGRWGFYARLANQRSPPSPPPHQVRKSCGTTRTLYLQVWDERVLEQVASELCM